MRTVILCGGYGTRIRDVSEDLPKAMVPVGGRPILWHLMDYYASWEFSDFVLCLGYKAHTIKDFLVNYRTRVSDFTIRMGPSLLEVTTHADDIDRGDLTVTAVDTGLTAMTGARIRRIERYVAGDSHFMLTYGDGLSDVDLSALVSYHMAHGRILTVCGARPPGRFGELSCDSSGLAVEFDEKPQVGGGRISAGFFVCSPELFGYLDDRDDLVFERGPMQQLVRDRQMMVYLHEGFWQPMDTPRDHHRLEELYMSGRAPWVRMRSPIEPGGPRR